jgi:hypothetical protein
VCVWLLSIRDGEVSRKQGLGKVTRHLRSLSLA